MSQITLLSTHTHTHTHTDITNIIKTHHKILPKSTSTFNTYSHNPHIYTIYTEHTRTIRSSIFIILSSSTELERLHIVSANNGSAKLKDFI